jgi:GNAT superfamily N-acetyltransferase
MTEKVELCVLRKGEVRSGQLPASWEDPERHTVLSPAQRRMVLDNPLGGGDDDPCRALVIIDGYVAGHVGLLMSEVTVEGQRLPVLWGYNLLVSTRFRGRGIATKLLKCWQDHHHTAIGTNVNLESVGIYRKLGWTEFHTPHYFVVRRSRRFLEGYVGVPPLAALASPVVDAGLALRRGWGRLVAGRLNRRLRAEAVASLSPELDSLLARQSVPVVTPRSAAYIDYLLHAAEADDTRDTRLCLVRDESGAAVGYFIIQRKEPPLPSGRFRHVRRGSMRDWGIFDEGKADALSIALLATHEFFDWGGDAFKAVLPDDGDGHVLRRLGFGAAESLCTVFHADPSSPLAGDEFKEQRAWRFTPAEADGLLT